MTTASKPKILLLIPTFQPHDAVGNDILGMYQTLTAAGYETVIWGEHIHPSCRQFARFIGPEADSFWRDPNSILIYHHAIAWELGERILAKSRNKIIVKYHNVTPAHFFAGLVEHYYWACIEGREANARLLQFPILQLWGDSRYNCQEFIDLGMPADRCRVLAPLHKVEELGLEPLDTVLIGAYRDPRPNILFVGGLRPNKGHSKAVEIFARYRVLSGRDPRLFFVGNFDPALAGYIEQIKAQIKQHDLDVDVHFAHSVSPSQMRTYYTLASVFLCVSEHEGFCVPLVEAMHFRAPIVAWDSTAVGETTGDAGVVLQDYDPEAFAEALDECVENPAMSRALAQRGRERYESVFHDRVLRASLLRMVEEVEKL